MTPRTDPLRLHGQEPHTQRSFWDGRTYTPSQLHQETEAEQERRTREARRDKETGELFGPTVKPTGDIHGNG